MSSQVKRVHITFKAIFWWYHRDDDDIEKKFTIAFGLVNLNNQNCRWLPSKQNLHDTKKNCFSRSEKKYEYALFFNKNSQTYYFDTS